MRKIFYGYGFSLTGEFLMLVIIRIFAHAVLLLSFSLSFFAHAQTPQKIGTGSISGTVTVAGKPAAGLLVTVKKTDGENSQNNPGTNAATDANGIFTFDKLPAANYRVSVSAPGFYNPKKKNEWDDGGASVNLAEGERVDKLAFTLSNGAVVTGRLFDERGRAVIEENIVLKKQGNEGKSQTVPCTEQSDDRGIYRCYGLEPGKYIIGAGIDPSEGSANLGNGNYFTRAWYPGVTDLTQARIIEIKTTEEAAGIDIRLARRKKGFKIMGKAMEADSGKPVIGAMLALAPLGEKGEVNGISMGQNSTSNAAGEFKIDGLTSGRYKLIYWKMGGSSEFTAKPISFEIKDDDVTGLEMKMEKGATITAVVALESASNQGLQKKFSALNFVAFSQDPKSQEGDWFSNSQSLSGLDGTNTAHFSGVGAGKVMFHVVRNDVKGFSIAWVEQNGRSVSDGLTVTAGEQVAGVRLIVVYSSASIRGEIKVEGGTLPEDVNLDVTLKATDDPSKTFNANADARGKYLLEGIPAGTYELVVATYANRPPYDTPSINLQPNTKTIQVANGQEQTINLVVQIGSREVKQ